MKHVWASQQITNYVRDGGSETILFIAVVPRALVNALSALKEYMVRKYDVLENRNISKSDLAIVTSIYSVENRRTFLNNIEICPIEIFLQEKIQLTILKSE